ncbi:hypothetical protein C9374_000734 [Naegleria lovaniensis]|uniref:Uncharacterized protein n=1 Tax=Naegleria lovaniensis TaxID=51637 RepID=A0AA88GXG4_NAELO|nr:uncharacterized protein C9374_013654 [Naegleria lovaniensis]XP_044551876.1 uncharacterized protein C9374_000734 [Naegleria lovaniensis]KAG2372699.1 hypothetical protein C9374_013654 [Naegleria lovaniensis]KAG2387884.1 hypothetical protein C9374_000734 [Naegleria lovaniensis]
MTNIELVNAPLSQPFDVKISYNHEYIICTDCGDPGRILFFDLNSKQFQFSIPTPSYGPMFLCIEEGYRNAFSDALFFDCKGDKSLHKYDLQSFVFNKQRDQEYSDCDEESPLQGKIWTSVCVQGATGISIMQSQSKLFVGCFDRTVKILDSNTGTLIDVVALMNTLPLGINFFEMGKNHYLIVGGWKKIEFFVKQVDVCQETWSCLQNNAGLIHSSGSNTYGTVFDPISRCLIVPTQDTVLCYRLFESTHLEWTLINKVDVHNFARPQGLCLNDRSGELLVCERGANRIRIYQ